MELEGDGRKSTWKYNKRHWITPEIKIRNTSHFGTRFTTTAAGNQLVGISVGTGISERVGKRIRMISLECHGYIVNETAANCNKCDMLVVYDRRPAGGTPPITDVLNSATSCTNILDSNADRFEIVYRKSYVLVGASGTASTTMTSSTAVDCSFLLDLQGRPVVYKLVTDGSSFNVSEGNLILYLVCQALAATNNVATLTAALRVRYVDD